MMTNPAAGSSKATHRCTSVSGTAARLRTGQFALEFELPVKPLAYYRVPADPR